MRLRPSATLERRQLICPAARDQRGAGRRGLQAVEVHAGERHGAREAEVVCSPAFVVEFNKAIVLLQSNQKRFWCTGERARAPPGDVGRAVDVAPVAVEPVEELDGDPQLRGPSPRRIEGDPKVVQTCERLYIKTSFTMCAVDRTDGSNGRPRFAHARPGRTCRRRRRSRASGTGRRGRRIQNESCMGTTYAE
jgi:hypothetical protein